VNISAKRPFQQVYDDYDPYQDVITAEKRDSDGRVVGTIIIGSERPPRRKRRRRKPSLARMITRAKRLGVDLKVNPDGGCTFQCGGGQHQVARNEWDEELIHGKH
jgi:hypothetical protein